MFKIKVFRTTLKYSPIVFLHHLIEHSFVNVLRQLLTTVPTVPTAS